MKKSIKNITKDSEFIDNDGKKWVQTSTEDLFSIKEMQDVFERVEKDKETGEIVLARIDFQSVNKDYYDKVLELQAELKRKNDALKRLLIEAKRNIKKKNEKLKELIIYIKKLHLLLAYYNSNPEFIEKSDIVKSILQGAKDIKDDFPIFEIKEAAVQEIQLDDDGKETKPL
jgi:hypothetical protein